MFYLIISYALGDVGYLKWLSKIKFIFIFSCFYLER